MLEKFQRTIKDYLHKIKDSDVAHEESEKMTTEEPAAEPAVEPAAEPAADATQDMQVVSGSCKV